MVDYFFKETQTQLILTPIICALIALLFSATFANTFLILCGLLFALLYMLQDFITVQDKHKLMLHTMPISSRMITHIHFRYLFVVAFMYSLMFILLYLLMKVAFSTLALLHILAVSLIVFSVLPIVISLFLVLYYTLPKGVLYIIAGVNLFFIFGGYRLLIDGMLAFSTSFDFHNGLFILPIIAVALCCLLYQIALRQCARVDI